jgi:hypothetical protein
VTDFHTLAIEILVTKEEIYIFLKKNGVVIGTPCFMVDPLM